jgi:hypothetical protein
VKALADGASGFVDSRPCPAWPRPAATTAPRLLRRRQQTIHGDVHDPATFSTPLAGCERPATSCYPLSDTDFSATMPAPPKRSAKRRREPA